MKLPDISGEWALAILFVAAVMVCCYEAEKAETWEDKYYAMEAQARKQQEAAELAAAEEKKRYEQQKAADAVLVSSLRSSLERVRSSAFSLKRTAAAPAGSNGDSGQPDVLGALIEGAELAVEGAELARREHTALRACVDQYQRVANEYRTQ